MIDQPLMTLTLESCTFDFPFHITANLSNFPLPMGVSPSDVTKIEAVIFSNHIGGDRGTASYGYDFVIGGSVFSSGPSGGPFGLGKETQTVTVSPSVAYPDPTLFSFATTEIEADFGANIAGLYLDRAVIGCGLIVTYGAGLQVFVFPTVFTQTNFSSGFGTGTASWSIMGAIGGGYMPLPVLLLPPDQANYTTLVGETVIATKLDGGASRFRSDKLDAAHTVTVQWDCNQANYDYLTAFYRTAISNGADPFTIDLILDSGTLQTYTVHIMPGTFGINSTSGLEFLVWATLELISDDSYASGDAAIITAGPD